MDFRIKLRGDILDYYHSFKDVNGYIYSCDNIRLEFRLSAIGELLERVSNFFAVNCDKYVISFKIFNYKHCFTFNCDVDTSFTVLVGLNNCSRLKSVVVFDFNPNKVMKYDIFKKIISYFYSLCWDTLGKHSYIREVSIKRYDLAVDIPFRRDFVKIVWNGKGAKRHEVVETTALDRTDYFGERNIPGRLKIYNKSLEYYNKQSKKERDLYNLGYYGYYTRIEVTHDTNDSMILLGSFPCVFTKYDVSCLDDVLTPVDYILVNACLNDSTNIVYLKKSDKWKKLKKYVFDNLIEYDVNCINDVLFDVFSYTDMSSYGCFITSDLEDFFKNVNRSNSVPHISFDDEHLDDEFEEIVDDNLKPF